MKVIALREHQNQNGNNFLKQKDEVYLHPRPEGDIASGVVKKAGENAELTAKRPRQAKAAKRGKSASTKIKSPPSETVEK